MELTKKSKIVIAVAVVLVVLIIVGIIVGIVIWNNETIDNSAHLTNHTFTVQEARFVKNVLPMVLLLPENIDNDIEFFYERHQGSGGIKETRLSEIKVAAKENKRLELSDKDFHWLRYCVTEIKNEKYVIQYIVRYDGLGYPYIVATDPNEKNEEKLSLNRTYYYDRSTSIMVSIYPHNYQENSLNKPWAELSHDEKIELYGREWFDSVELSDIDEFMKEVCAYNGINSDWLDNKPIYNI